MDYYRKLYASEKDFLLNTMQNEIGRKMIHIFFGIWKSMFFIGLIGMIYGVIDAIKNQEYFMIVSVVFGLPMMFLWFWVFPNFILRNVDSKLDAVKNDRVMLREVELVSVRMNRERTSSSSHNYHDVYYASIWSEDKSHTYEVLTNVEVSRLTPGTIVYLLRFTKKKNTMVNDEYVLPVDFASNSNTQIPL